jgi:hypothetical protein
MPGVVRSRGMSFGETTSVVCTSPESSAATRTRSLAMKR